MPETLQLTLDLIFSHEQWREFDDLEHKISSAANATFETAGKLRGAQGPFEVAINLSGDAQVTQLNHQFRGKNEPTNVLSFPFDDQSPQLNPGPKPLGDIILAVETVVKEANEQGKPLDHQIAHLVVHGMLHLFGYDHVEENEAVEMEQLECRILSSLHIPSPYHNT